MKGRGVRIGARYVEEDPLWGRGLVLYLENGGGESYYIEARNLSLDGYSGVVLRPGRKAFERIYVLSEDLAECGIAAPKEAEITFSLLSPDSMEELFSETVSFPL